MKSMTTYLYEALNIITRVNIDSIIRYTLSKRDLDIVYNVLNAKSSRALDNKLTRLSDEIKANLNNHYQSMHITLLKSMNYIVDRDFDKENKCKKLIKKYADSSIEVTDIELKNMYDGFVRLNNNTFRVIKSIVFLNFYSVIRTDGHRFFVINITKFNQSGTKVISTYTYQMGVNYLSDYDILIKYSLEYIRKLYVSKLGLNIDKYIEWLSNIGRDQLENKYINKIKNK